MTRIIGHRGAAGLALENTLESFRKAFEVGVDTVELDVQVTKDGAFVVSHDSNLRRVSGSWASISNLTYNELAQIKLLNGESIPLLETVLNLVESQKKRVIVELKVNSNLETFVHLIQRYEKTVQAVAAEYSLLLALRKLGPTLKLYVVERLNPFAGVHKARMVNAAGIDMNFWLLNPLIYWIARHYKLELMVYTVNGKLISRFLQRLYPLVSICTNVPHKFLETAAAIEHRALPAYKSPKNPKKHSA